MRAFSQLCQKVNFSVFGNTLTIFPKKTGKTHSKFIWAEGVFKEIDCYSLESSHIVEMENQLKVSRWVRHNDNDHPSFHQDGLFNREAKHYHAQFALVIDETRLKQVLGVFKQHQFIDEQEEAQFIENFKLANRLDANEYFTEQLAKIQELIKDLRTKVEHDPDNYKQLVTVAINLCENLQAEHTRFLADNSSSISAEEFKTRVLPVINEAQGVFKNHRGYKEVLTNMALAAAMLFLPYIAIGLYNVAQKKDFMFFKVKTDSCETVDRLEAALFSSQTSR